MDLYQILDVDTEIFGYPVAKIIPDTLALDELDCILMQLKKDGVRLVYWASDPAHQESQYAAHFFEGFLVDRKIAFVSDIEDSPRLTDPSIGEYNADVPCPELEALSVSIGRNSRFFYDPRIPVEKCDAMYKLWIRNSVNGPMADAVLVSWYSGKIVGMITVSEKDGRGNIGLCAVDADHRRKCFGKALVRAAQEWARQKGLNLIQVVTQSNNIAACNLYHKMRYQSEKIDYFYHFWI